MIEEYMIWFWVGIFFVLAGLTIWTKNMIPFLLGISNLATIVINFAFHLKYYFEILIFFLLALILILAYLFKLKFKKNEVDSIE